MTIYEGTEITPPAQYAAIKGGLISFTRYLASYYGQKSIKLIAFHLVVSLIIKILFC